MKTTSLTNRSSLPLSGNSLLSHPLDSSSSSSGVRFLHSPSVSNSSSSPSSELSLQSTSLGLRSNSYSSVFELQSPINNCGRSQTMSWLDLHYPTSLQRSCSLSNSSLSQQFTPFFRVKSPVGNTPFMIQQLLVGFGTQY